ncbi:MAG: hypothetical protein ACRDZ4_19970 [Egibacteraceae bacterium]
MVEATTTVAVDAERRDALADRLFHALLETLELTSVYLGLRLDLYAALRDGGPATPAGLAARAGIDERYAREWLEQQAVAGLLEVGESSASEDSLPFRLPAAHAEVLLDVSSPAHAAAAALFVGSIAQVLQRLPEAYRTGAGVPYADYGADCRHGIARFNQPMFANELQGWLAAAPDVRARLQTEPAARVLDVACGLG